jgi:cytoplasmic iron level regulating protein YaaA (DUF328/UPF0246 family)
VLIVVSPAKSLDFESKLATKKFSEPEMLDRSEELVAVMASKSPDEISALMHVSPALGELNFGRFHDWERPFTPRNARAALLAFNGDVYMGMDASNSFSERDFTHAQKTLRILSGLYGVLRPLDLMQPYRLEMGTKLKTTSGSDLYSFWGNEITENLNRAVETSPGTKVLVNLASNEYFSAVRPDALVAPIISPVFLDAKGDADFKIVSFFAKRARGVMSAWIIQNRVRSRSALVEFAGMGYHYDSERSSADRPVFIRRNDA